MASLHKNGRVFLVECFHENEDLADSVNHLLVVGFYLYEVRKNPILKQVMQTEFSTEEGVKLKNIHYTQKDPEKNLTWLLDAKEVTFSEDRQVMTFRNFKLRLESKDRPAIELQGKRGDYNKKTEIITLHGDLLGTMRRFPSTVWRMLRARRAWPPEMGYVYFQDFVPGKLHTM